MRHLLAPIIRPPPPVFLLPLCRAQTAHIQDALVHALKGQAEVALAARSVGVVDTASDRDALRALFATLTNVNFDPLRWWVLSLPSATSTEIFLNTNTAIFEAGLSAHACQCLLCCTSSSTPLLQRRYGALLLGAAGSPKGQDRRSGQGGGQAQPAHRPVRLRQLDALCAGPGVSGEGGRQCGSAGEA